ncbi:MAG: LacI family DNA-binding transcriptional regulator [Anaerolineales bacterium]|nr:LacI family DNA-binding transcriptional regulator [Anaerolineales bacterium]
MDDYSTTIMNKRPTIKEVAKAAGVSTQTVSRVINNRPDVAPETRKRIEQIISEMDYRPSALARSLIRQRSYTLGVVTAGLKYIGPSRTLSGITSRAEELGYTLLLKEFPRFDIAEIEPLLQTLLSRHVDGIVWAVPEVGNNRKQLESKLADLPVPLVFLTMESRPNLSIVTIDNYLGAKLATEHLLEQGYRHIGHISGPMDWWESRQRKAGWQAALTAAGVTALDLHCVEGNWSSASGEVAFQQLLTQYPEIDAVFAGNDQMALSALQVASREHIAVPQQLGVVGFDGLAESPYYWPPLTTIVQDQHLLGCTVIEEIVHLIEAAQRDDAATTPKTILLQPELVVRESTQRRL